MTGEETNPPSHKTKDVALANKQEDIQEEIRDKIDRLMVSNIAPLNELPWYPGSLSLC